MEEDNYRDKDFVLLIIEFVFHCVPKQSEEKQL
jgi:hypothetical protein